MLVGLGFFLSFFFLFTYGIAAYTDFKTRRIDARGFYFLKGLVLTGIFLVPGKSILIALGILGIYYLTSILSKRFRHYSFFSTGDFTMMMPFSLLMYLFVDIWLWGLIHLTVLLLGLLWFLLSKQRSYAPVLFFSLVIFFGIMYGKILLL